MTSVITRDDAKMQGFKLFFTAKRCKRGHLDERYVSDGSCITCNRVYDKLWQKENLERQRENAKKWNDANRERINASGRRWYAKNRERASETSKLWYVENRESYRTYNKQYCEENPELVRENAKRWREANRDKCSAASKRWAVANSDKLAAYGAKRRAMKLNATPSWFTSKHEKQIGAFYVKAARLSLETGVPHHVDHIFPLKAKRRGSRKQIASGLHVPWNLQIIKKAKNLSKGCYIDDLPMHELIGCADSLGRDQARTA